MASIARDTRPLETTRAFAEIVAVVDEHILGKVHLWWLIRVHWLIFNGGKQTDTNVEVDVKIPGEFIPPEGPFHHCEMRLRDNHGLSELL